MRVCTIMADSEKKSSAAPSSSKLPELTADLVRPSLAGYVADEASEKGEEEEGVWDGWGYMRAKKRKLREQFADIGQEKTSELFSGVTIYVNGWTQPNADELKRLIHAHGGRYEYNLYGDSGVTHIIATNLPNVKIKNLGDTCVCTPGWIVDSVAAGKRLPVQNYLLYTQHATCQKRLKFTKVEREEEGALLSSSEQASSLPIGKDQDDMVTSHSTGIATEQTHPSKQIQPASLESLIPKAKPSQSRSYDAAKGAEFVSDFYAYSRLHYLSTWSMELKQFTSKTLPQITQKYPKLPPEISFGSRGQRLVAHIDLDCFFVSVSLRDKPHLKGKPVAVCHAKLPKEKAQEHQEQEGLSLDTKSPPISSATRDEMPLPALSQGSSSVPQYLLKSMSDIASCSYEARSAGLHNGMFVGEALKRCPELQLLPYEFEKYHEVSKLFYTILMSYSATLEAVSCDEAYVELTDYVKNVEDARNIVQAARDEIKASTGCTVSAGVGQNMLLARMATRVAKPNGQYFLSAEEAWEFLGDQRVHDLPGVGYSTALKLREMGVETCSQLRQLSVAKLKSDFGSKTGQILYNYCRGKDERQLKLASERKSLSVDLNFGIRFKTSSDAENLLENLSEELERRATEAKVQGGTITLKLMIRKPEAPSETRKYLGHGRCNNVSRSCSLLQPTGEATEISRLAVRLLKQINPQPEDIRGVGLQLTRLVSSQQIGSGKSDLRSMLTAKPQLPSHITAQEFPALPNLPGPTSTTQISPRQPITSLSESTGAGLDDTFTVDLPPASQLDSSVLEALPPALKEKILSGYAKLEQTSAPTVPSVKSSSTGSGVEKSASVHMPPAIPGHSPSSTARGGVGRRGRGRGRRRGTGSPQRSPLKRGVALMGPDVSPAKQKRLTDHLTVEAVNTAQSGIADSTVDSKLQQPDSFVIEPRTTVPPSVEEETVIENNKIIIDRHARFLSEFRTYLKKWVNDSPTGPLDSDLAKVVSYFTQLCDTDLEAVFVVLRGFRRHIVRVEIRAWSAAFNSLLEAVQGCVQVDYKGALPIDRL